MRLVPGLQDPELFRACWPGEVPIPASRRHERLEAEEAPGPGAAEGRAGMSPEDFTEVVRRRLIRCEFVLVPKGHEYSRGGDRLHNFKKAAEIEKTTPEKALLGMAMKHIVSIMDMVEDLPTLPAEETQAEKFTDAINYLLLLEALIEERRT